MSRSWVRELAVKGLPGLAMVSSVMPLDRAQVLLQADSCAPYSKYTRVTDALGEVLRTEGVLGLWRGLWMEVLVYYPRHVVNAVVRDVVRILYPRVNADSRPMRAVWNAVATSALTGCISLFFWMPVDYLVVHIRKDVGYDRPEGGVSAVAARAMRHGGTFGMYTGFVPALLQIVAHRAALSFAAAPIDRAVAKRKRTWAAVFAGLQAKVLVATLLSFPFHVLRVKRVVDADGPVGGRMYRGTWHCLLKTLYEDGVLGLYSGFGSALLKMVLSAAVGIALTRASSEAPTPPHPLEEDRSQPAPRTGPGTGGGWPKHQ